MLRAKHVKLRRELPSLVQKLPCIREKLPSFAANRSVRARTFIDCSCATSAGNLHIEESRIKTAKSHVEMVNCDTVEFMTDQE
jgi:hypothetical protein